MEQWELQIQGFPALPEPRVFAKAIQTAADVLKGDLADFETERLFHTFLEPPVDLLSTVLNNFQEEEWSNAIIEAFKMLGTIAGKYVNALDPYFENIVKIHIGADNGTKCTISKNGVIMVRVMCRMDWQKQTYLTFWIWHSHGEVIVQSGYDHSDSLELAISWKDPEPFSVVYYGLRARLGEQLSVLLIGGGNV